MSGRIIVINPNSSEPVSAAMDQALEPLRQGAEQEISVVTNRAGPPGIETQSHADQAARDVCDIVRAHQADTRAYVVGCFSDPGLHAAREMTDRPVFGIAESGILTALALGNRFGIIAILPQSVPRHIRYVRSLGLDARLAGDLPVGLGVTELADTTVTASRLRAVGERLRDENGADVLVLGCAGMAQYRHSLEAQLHVAVVDPVQAATAMALSAIRFGQSNSTRHRLS